MASTRAGTEAEEEDGRVALAAMPLELDLLLDGLGGVFAGRWEEIKECTYKIRHHQALLEHYKGELQKMEQLHRSETAVTRLLHDPYRMWRETEDRLKYSKPVVLAILQAEGQLPPALEEDWWNSGDPHVYRFSLESLRCDKQIFLARLHRPTFCSHYEYRWYRDGTKVLTVPTCLLKQKDILSKLFEKYPSYLLQPNVPDWLFDDDDAFKCFAHHSRANTWGSQILKALLRFSPRIRNDPDMMIRVILQICSSPRFRVLPTDRLINGRVLPSFVGDRLRAEKAFCLKVAKTIAARFPRKQRRRRSCPLWLRDLSAPLRNDTEVVTAFCRINGLNLASASVRLRSLPSVARTACGENASAILYVVDSNLCTQTMLLSNPKFARQALKEASKRNKVRVFKQLPERTQRDLELNVLACLEAPSLLKPIKNRWKDEKQFWTRLVDKQFYEYDSRFAWKDIPVSMRRDAEVARSYAPLHCRTLACLVEVLADAPSTLADLEEEDLIDIAREILWNEEYEKRDWLPLLTLLPVGWRSNHPLCVDMVHGQSYVYQFLPLDFQRDREIVEATLVSATLDCFCEIISTDIQAMFPELIAQWVKSNDREARKADFFRRIDLQLARELWSNRDFVIAFTEAGGSRYCGRFGFDYNDYREDRTVLLAVGKISAQRFAKMCPTTYRRDKEFMLQAIGVKSSLLRAASHSLLNDFDFLSKAIAINKDTISFMDSNLVNNKSPFPPNVVFITTPTQGEREKRGMLKLSALARHVRYNLHSHRGFRELLRGIGAGQKVNRGSPLTLLNQGSETSVAYKRRIAEFLGAPLCAEFKRQRELLIELTRWGY